ncbi:MAG: molybdopterin dinucleotide binding domain-containing protein [Pirellulales bacterium]
MLLTGRGSASQWHAETRTRQSPLLQSMRRLESYVEMHAEDAKRFA